MPYSVNAATISSSSSPSDNRNARNIRKRRFGKTGEEPGCPASRAYGNSTPYAESSSPGAGRNPQNLHRAGSISPSTPRALLAASRTAAASPGRSPTEVSPAPPPAAVSHPEGRSGLRLRHRLPDKCADAGQGSHVSAESSHRQTLSSPPYFLAQQTAAPSPHLFKLPAS